MDSDIGDDTLDQLTKVNNLEYNTLKLIEEMAETSEVLVKTLTKSPKYKPSKEKIVEEMGDLFLRFYVVMQHMNITDEVEQRVEDKLLIFQKAMDKGKMGSKVTIEHSNN